MTLFNIDTTKNYHRSLMILGVLLMVLFIILAIFSYWQVRQYTIDQHKERLSDFLALHKAMHHYIEEEQKPVFYELAKLGTIDAVFFDKRAMSFTYIARKIHERYMVNRQKRGLRVFNYKLASNNPRNPLNQANEFEAQLLSDFNAGRTTPYTETIHNQQGQESLYYATPVGANVASCMRCHSDPKLAPANLIIEYGDKAGFGEKIGDIRALISLTYPLDEAFSESYRQWLLLSLIAFIILAIFYAIVTYFLHRMHKQHLIIKRQTQTDSLTGLLNRQQMNKNIDDIIKNEQPISLIMMDIDHFKTINDTFGHTVGDDVLVQLAQILLQLPKPINSYRFGGEEFLLLLPKTDAQQAAQIAETLRQQVSAAVFLSINTTLTISLGVATNTASDTSQTLLKRADNMLYLAKQKGRNRTETDQDSPDS